MRSPDATKHEGAKRSRTLVGAIALLVGCSVCLVPGLLAGGVLAGALSWLAGASAWVIGGLALLAGVTLLAFLRGRTKANTDSACGGCGCTSKPHP